MAAKRTTTKASYTLEMFAEFEIPAVIDTDGYDDPRAPQYDHEPMLYGGDSAYWANGRVARARKDWLRNYRAQCTWTNRIERLLADETPWHARPVPVVDWSPAGMAKWSRATMSDYPVNQAPEVKAFRKALAAIPDSSRDASGPSPHRGACAQCMYDAYLATLTHEVYRNGRYVTEHDDSATHGRPIPHTCGRVAASIPTRATRRKAA